MRQSRHCVVCTLGVAEAGAGAFVSVHLQSSDGRHLASVRTGTAAERAGTSTMSTEAAPTVASVLLELQSGSSWEPTTAAQAVSRIRHARLADGAHECNRRRMGHRAVAALGRSGGGA